MEYWTVDAEGRCTECPFNGQCRYQENDVKHKCNNEMTQEEKAKAYDEAIERARIWKEKSGMPIDKQGILDDIFPELKKNEGEESKKWILEYLHDGLRKSDEQFKDHFRTAIAWLEKQGKCETGCPQNHQDVNHPNGCITMEDFSGGEGFYKLNIEYLNKRQVEEIEEIVRTWNKDADCKLCTSKKHCISIEKQEEMDIEKPTTIGKRQLTGKAAELAKEVTPKSLEETKKKMLEETGPKFKVGDWIINRTNATIAQIVAVTGSFYDYREQSGQRTMSYQEYAEWDFRLWSITDAKDGDVLAGKIDGDDYILIFKQIKDGWVETYGHYYDAVDRFCAPSQLFCRDYKGTLHPAAKEQRDLLFEKMKENGYEWDAEKKELSHQEVTKKSEQEPTNWNDKDEELFTSYSNNVLELWKKEYAEEFINWIKSLKQRLS